MPIIVENQDVTADIDYTDGELNIHFRDPSFVRCDIILVDMTHRRIGGLLHEGYHGMSGWPENLGPDTAGTLKMARLRAHGASGEVFKLSAPVKFMDNSGF